LELSRLPSDDTDASSSDDYTEVISDTSLPGIGPFEENILGMCDMLATMQNDPFSILLGYMRVILKT